MTERKNGEKERRETERNGEKRRERTGRETERKFPPVLFRREEISPRRFSRLAPETSRPLLSAKRLLPLLLSGLLSDGTPLGSTRRNVGNSLVSGDGIDGAGSPSPSPALREPVRSFSCCSSVEFHRRGVSQAGLVWSFSGGGFLRRG